jgi:hypothetical protein
MINFKSTWGLNNGEHGSNAFVFEIILHSSYLGPVWIH